MLIDFSSLDQTVLPHFYGGEKELCGKMHVDENGKIILGTLEPGASIGLHTHETSSEIIYVLSGSGRILYDGSHEFLTPGCCHYCPKGHTHSMSNDGSEPLQFLAVVPNQ